MMPSSTTQGFISLVTGDVYDNTGTIVDDGYSILSKYETEYGSLSSDVESSISTASTSYDTAMKDANVSGTGTSSSDVDSDSSSNTGNDTETDVTPLSLTSRASDAAGDSGFDLDDLFG